MKYLIYFLLFVFASCNSTNTKNTATNTGEYGELKAKIDSLFNSKIGEDEPGAAVLIAYDGKIVVGKGYGLRDVENKLPITPATNMRMASVSKQFTTLTVLSLVDKGLLTLSDSLYKIFPLESFQNVTIEQLINHTSGIADAEDSFYTEWDTSQVISNEDVIKWYSKNNNPFFSPGESWKYNNGAYEILPVIVEKVSGQDFSSYAKENIFDKAGMEQTNFYNPFEPVPINERAVCYEKDSLGWKKMDVHFLDGLMGAGGVLTSVNDYFQYDLALRNNSIFSKETHSLIFNPSASFVDKDKQKYYGMGWFVTDSTATHSGGWFGVDTYVKRYLDRPLTIAIFMNSNTLFENNGYIVKQTDSLANVFLRKSF